MLRYFTVLAMTGRPSSCDLVDTVAERIDSVPAALPPAQFRVGSGAGSSEIHGTLRYYVNASQQLAGYSWLAAEVSPLANYYSTVVSQAKIAIASPRLPRSLMVNPHPFQLWSVLGSYTRGNFLAARRLADQSRDTVSRIGKTPGEVTGTVWN